MTTITPPRPPLTVVRAEVVETLSDGPGDLNAEEWRVAMYFLAPEVAALGRGVAGCEGDASAGDGQALEVGGAEWRRSVARAAADCFPDLAPARALHRFNVVLARPHVRLAVDAFREAEAVAVAGHRTALRRAALAIVERALPSADGEFVRESDVAKLQLAQVAAMRFLAELDGHFFAAREAATERRALAAEAVARAASGGAAAAEEDRVAAALAAKLQAAGG